MFDSGLPVKSAPVNKIRVRKFVFPSSLFLIAVIWTQMLLIMHCFTIFAPLGVEIVADKRNDAKGLPLIRRRLEAPKRSTFANVRFLIKKVLV